MGFMDKVKDTATQGLKAGQGKLDQLQGKKQGDALLRDLGALVYASQTGRANSDNASQTQAVLTMLQQHESTHGQINLLPESPGVAPPAPYDPNMPGGGGFIPGGGGMVQDQPAGFVPGGSPAPVAQPAFVPGGSPAPVAQPAFVPGAAPAAGAPAFVPAAAPAFVPGATEASAPAAEQSPSPASAPTFMEQAAAVAQSAPMAGAAPAGAGAPFIPGADPLQSTAAGDEAPEATDESALEASEDSAEGSAS